MQEAEWVLDSFIKGLVIRERFDRFSIEKLVDFRDIQNFHGALLQEVFHQRKTGLLARFDPNIAFCCIEDCQCPFSVILGRKKQGLRERKKQATSASRTPSFIHRGIEQFILTA